MPIILASTLRQLWPRGNSKIAGLIEGIAASSARVFSKYGLTNDLLVAHAMAQFSHECGEGLEMTENINYTAARACQVWPNRFNSEADVYTKVGSYAGDPQFHIKLIDVVYGNRMGNRPGTHDGSTYIGRGLSQCTGRENYLKLGTNTGIDVIGHPEYLSDPTYALELGVADFILCGCLPYAQKDDVDGVTKHLNGGYVGLDKRKAWLVKWKSALANAPTSVPEPAPAPAPRPTPAPAPKPIPAPQPQPQATGLGALIMAIIKAILSIFQRKQ
jgi:putative chitinase